jgi:hypothetical protein
VTSYVDFLDVSNHSFPEENDRLNDSFCCAIDSNYCQNGKSGCMRDGHRHNIHDSVVYELHRLIKYANRWLVREPKGFFRVDLPQNGNRPDISVRPCSYDVARPSCTFVDTLATCPIQGSQSSFRCRRSTQRKSR